MREFVISAVKVATNTESEGIMEELWLPIIGYEGLYDVSNLGRIRNSRTNKILRLGKHRQGYKLVSLYKNKKEKTFLAHRLVAMAFIENPHSFLEINHIDENKENNNVSNLEWCDRVYNANYGTGNKRRIEQRIKNGNNKGSKTSKNVGEQNPNCKLSAEQIKYIRNNYIKNDKAFGGVPLSKKFGVSKHYIYRIISNTRRIKG